MDVHVVIAREDLLRIRRRSRFPKVHVVIVEDVHVSQSQTPAGIAIELRIIGHRRAIQRHVAGQREHLGIEVLHAARFQLEPAHDEHITIARQYGLLRVVIAVDVHVVNAREHFHRISDGSGFGQIDVVIVERLHIAETKSTARIAIELRIVGHGRTIERQLPRDGDDVDVQIERPTRHDSGKIADFDAFARFAHRPDGTFATRLSTQRIRPAFHLATGRRAHASRRIEGNAIGRARERSRTRGGRFAGLSTEIFAVAYFGAVFRSIAATCRTAASRAVESQAIQLATEVARAEAQSRAGLSAQIHSIARFDFIFYAVPTARGRAAL